jgi:hypothetical protein
LAVGASGPAVTVRAVRRSVGGPGERADGGHVRHLTWRDPRAGWLEAGQRDDPGARLQAVDAAEARRYADRTDQIRAVLEERHPGGECGGGPAAGATGRALQVPGIPGDAEQLVGGLSEVGQHRGHIRLADEDRPCLPESRHHRRIVAGDVVLERRIAPGRVQPGDVERLLDRNGNTVQRPARRLRDRLVGCGRLFQRCLARSSTIPFTEGFTVSIRASIDSVSSHDDACLRRTRSAASLGDSKSNSAMAAPPLPPAELGAPSTFCRPRRVCEALRAVAASHHSNQ